MEVFLSPKIPKKFNCDSCHYYTSNKKDYDKHMLTSKHQKMTNGNNLEEMEVNKIPRYACECSKVFKTHGGLWKHKKGCGIDNYENSCNDTDSEVKLLTNVVLAVVKQNQEILKENGDLKHLIMDTQSQMLEVIKNGTHNTTNNTNMTNSHNKAFNLNFFLNETCKDAMNIMDFVDSIKLQLSDLEKVGELGYVEGISNIIVKNLNELDVTQRPVHCTDKKRETMYIRDEDKWEKDESNSKIKKAIKRVASKNQRLLPKFKEAHPDCGTYHSKYSDQYNKIIIESVGGSGDNDAEKEEKIIRNISKNVIVEK
jgi:hypothetical protein